MSTDAAIAQFEAAINAESKQVLGKVDQYLRDTAEDTVRELIGITPVDTGHAKANWQVTLTAPASGEVMATDTSPVGHADGPTLQAARNVLKGVTVNTSVIYISNMADYISRIVEDGHSGQTAPGEFSAALQRLEAKWA